jgi:hypothetical protein
MNEYNISCTKMNSKARAGAAFFLQTCDAVWVVGFFWIGI